MKKFITHNDEHIDVDGTSFQDYIHATYEQLTDIFGEPHNYEGYKTDAEWDIMFADKTVATIYNWKDGKNYCGREGVNVEYITDWHIGGHGKKSANKVKSVIGGM
tara:strand:+ start:78 stop:392 length:315 start_codon:yes stop_codon:yes gene_type:complete